METRCKVIQSFSRHLHTRSLGGPSNMLKKKISLIEKQRKKKNPKKNQLFVEVPESKSYLDTATLPMILTAVGGALFAKLLMMHDDSKSQEMIERKIKNAPAGQGTVRMLSREEWEDIKDVRPRTPFESKLARPKAKLRTGEHLRMDDFKDWTIDVLTDAFTRVEENVRYRAPIVQGYGPTETCCGGAFSEFDDTSVGRVGPPLPCCFVKLVSWDEGGYLTSDKPVPRGEVVIGGGCVTAGYYNNDAKTNEVCKVDERGMRWFYTDDVGRFHPDGCLEIIDRKKDIVKLQHGEYISLGKVEAALMSSNYVENIMTYADPSQKYCVALVVPSRHALEKWAKEVGVEFKDYPELCNKKEAVGEVQKSLSKEAKSAKLDKFELPAKIKLMPEPWTPESGLVTAALKLKREQLKAKFRNELEELYK